jgi:hypothetical protein
LFWFLLFCLLFLLSPFLIFLFFQVMHSIYKLQVFEGDSHTSFSLICCTGAGAVHGGCIGTVLLKQDKESWRARDYYSSQMLPQVAPHIPTLNSRRVAREAMHNISPIL